MGWCYRLPSQLFSTSNPFKYLLSFSIEVSTQYFEGNMSSTKNEHAIICNDVLMTAASMVGLLLTIARTEIDRRNK